MSSSASLEDHGERMVPAFHRPSLLYAEHYTRYAAARQIVAGKRVLDIASGSGYGSDLLAETAAHVVGVDVSPEAVEYARATFVRDNLEYRVGDAVAIPLEDDSVDVVVTFETIEHIEDYRAFMVEIDRVLAPDGIAIISTPNDLEFVEGNHFHLHEFVYDELLALVGQHFDHVDPYFQATWKAVALAPQSLLDAEGPITVPTVNLAPLAPEQYLYFYLVCSRQPVDVTLEPLLALGGHYSDRLLQGIEAGHDADKHGLVREIEEARAETARVRAELETVRATRAYRLARRISGAAARVGLARPGR
jgi:2-polyprenyl-3-methyl-5-hydroxy-6-metoxy-1,4-benzoquinol methylase